MRMKQEEMLAAFAKGETARLEEAFCVDDLKETVRRMLDAEGTGMPVKVGFNLKTDRRTGTSFLRLDIETGNLLPMFGSYGRLAWSRARVRNAFDASEAGTYKSIGKRHLHKDELALVPKSEQEDKIFASVKLEFMLSGHNECGGCNQSLGWLRFNAPHSPGRWTAHCEDGRRFGDLFD